MSSRLFPENIPYDLKQYTQWIVWRYEDREGTKPTKVPYCPLNGKLASVTDPATWSDFDTALAVSGNEHFDGLGFVLTAHDPFAFIDLDDTKDDPEALKVQLKVFDAFNSYSEKSPSGQGLHIICKGHTPTGRRRGHIELYTNERYMTVTGDVFLDKPIAERQTLLNTLWGELGGGAKVQVYEGDLVEKLPDQEVIEKAGAAVNGDKFSKLFAGDWQDDYPSQSEADQALINFFAFYTQNRTQIMRLFRNTPLGQREKAQRNSYLNYTINRAFDRMLPPIDFDGIKNQITDALAKDKPGNLAGLPANVTQAGQMYQAQPVHTKAPKRPSFGSIPYPPGLVGEIAQYIHDSSVRPVAEIALAAALGLMSGVCGRSYNVSGTGLNTYILLLAPTGTGKEAMNVGISKLMSYVQSGGLLGNEGMPVMPAVKEFIGPAEISSGQALLKHVGKQRNFVSIVGEFGLTMKRLAHPRASTSEIMLKKVLLDLFNKSGKGQVLRPTIYSDKDKNTEDVASPSFSLLGESVPETFYGNLDETMISDGLLPRFLIIEYSGKRPPLNEGHASVTPSIDMVRRFVDLCDNSLKLNSHNQILNIPYDQEATAFLNNVNNYVDDQINLPDQRDVIRHLWNRAHLKTLKLASLVAIGVDHNNPVITLPVAEWAFNLVRRDAEAIIGRFERGEFGGSAEESKQATDVIRVVKQYLKKPYEEIAKYGVIRKMHQDTVVPIAYVQRRLVAASAFRNDRIGATNAIKRTLQMFIDNGDIQEIGKTELANKYNKTGRAFVVTNPDRFV